MLSPCLTYLLASADPELLSRVELALLCAGAQVNLALSAEAVLAASCGSNPPHGILLDDRLTGMPMDQLLTALRSGKGGSGLSIVLISDSVPQMWLDRMDEGVLDDLIPRSAAPDYFRLRASAALAMRRLTCEFSALRENEARNAQLDRLTGVYSREALLSMIFCETDRAQRMRSSLSFLLFDVDDFGHWNSRLGFDACDKMLCEVVLRTARLLRSYDLLGRIGNDEFLIALPGCSVAHAVTLAERLRLEVFSLPCHVGAECIRLSACFGIAQSRGRSPVVVLREAEQALSLARETGPESIQVFDGPLRPDPTPVTLRSSSSG